MHVQLAEQAKLYDLEKKPREMAEKGVELGALWPAGERISASLKS